MNVIHEFHTPLRVKTPLGNGIALFVIDYGVHLNTCWAVSLKDKNWQIKHFDSNDIRLDRNSTYKID